MSTSPQHETLPARFFANARRLGSAIAHHHWSHGQWFPVGWSTMAGVVRDLASGLIELGHEPSEAVAILAETRREWTYVDLAIMSAGGVTVGLYPDLDTDEYRRLLALADARVCVVDARHLARILAIRDALPRLRTLVVMDAGELPTTTPGIVSYDELLRVGRRARHDIAEHVARLTHLDAATFLTTSGTESPAKLAMVTHGNLVHALRTWSQLELSPSPSDLGFTALPLAHSLARSFEHLGVWQGMATVYASERDDLVADLTDMRPTVMVTLPRWLQDLHSAVFDDMVTLLAGRKLLAWAGRIARHAVRHTHQGRAPSPRLEAQMRLARRLVWNRLRTCLGGRMRHVHVGGGAIACDLLYALEATGVRASTGWSMAETCGVGSLTRPGAFGDHAHVASVGHPVPGMELALAADGELLARGAAVFSGYYRSDAQTSAAFTPSGYLRTGDLARQADDKSYHITGRKSQLIVTASGNRVAPRALESLVCADPRIGQALVLGHGRPYLVALIAVRPSVQQIFDEKTVEGMVEDIIASINVDLPRAEQIRHFRVLPYELGSHGGELTPSFEIRRDVVFERFSYLIDEMY